MKQIIQNLKTGETILEEVPAPQVKKGYVLIKTHRTLVSLGTEKMLVEFGRSSLIAKARQQPDRVKQVLDKIKADGLVPTLEAVFKRLEEPLPLGYCNAGEVIGVGEGVTDFRIGDRVVSNGQHAEVVCIPKNLVTLIPANVSYEEAAFTVIGSIGLQGIRLANPTFGETVVVSGLGLIGLMTAELLKANGCNVIGYDFDQSKVDLANSKGIKAYNLATGTDPVKTAMELTGGVGADAVIITASTKSDELISQAAKMSRKRGRIILVGVIGLNISRADFYEKELSFQVSCSYGPGRYDEDYERRGNDYPQAFVRWTENRNFQAILNAISVGTVDVKPLITEIVDLKDYLNIYGAMGANNAIASILKYDTSIEHKTSVVIPQKIAAASKGSMAIVGAGNFTKMTMLPILAKLKTPIKYIVSDSGVSGTFLAKKYGVGVSSTNYDDVLSDKSVDAVVITTRHNLHAEMALKALKADKHIFVEKPLALNEAELDQIIDTFKTTGKSVMVGFNRRFAPFSQKAKKLVGTSTEPMNIVINANAGAIPANHWTQHMSTGGGRIIGEACHFIDLVTFYAGSPVKEVYATGMGTNPAENCDNVSIIVKLVNGSQGVVNYFANGSKAYSKERVEIYSEGKTLIIDNFRKIEGFGFKGFSKDSGSQDKGHAAQFTAYNKFLAEGGKPIISFEEIVNSTKASFAAVKSFMTGEKVVL